MTPEPNETDEFTGIFSFEANIGDTLLRSCYKGYEVVITDASQNRVEKHRVKAGQSLEDTDWYLNLDCHQGYTDPATGIHYEFLGLSKRADSENWYEASEPVTKNRKLYVVYEQEDDSLWQEAKEALRQEIDRANALKNNGSVKQEDRDALNDAVNSAVGVLNRLPRPSIDELNSEREALKELSDRISSGLGGGGNDGPNRPDPNPNPNPNPNPGGNGVSSGGSGGGGGGSRSIVGGSASGSVQNSYRTYQAGTDGNWDCFDKAGHKWAFVLGSGNREKDCWANIRYTHEGVSRIETYYFDSEGVMDSGWFLERSTGRWYFLSDVHDGWFGQLLKGWHHDAADGKWYYLNPFTGAMMLGWQKIDGKWYYLTPENTQQTWTYNEASKRWEYTNLAERPLGSMYENEVTPDEYRVDGNGAWMQETP